MINTDVGYVYILTNKYIPNLVKLGYTNREPTTRADELSMATGVPGRWEVFHYWKLKGAYETEQYIFEKLSNYRETGEFLKLSGNEAVHKISPILVLKGKIGLDNLSQVERQGVKDLRLKNSELDKEEKVKRERNEYVKLFTEIDRELRQANKLLMSQKFDEYSPLMKKKQIRDALIWGGCVLITLLIIPENSDGAFLIAGIVALFAYGMGGGWPDIAASDEIKASRENMIKTIWGKYGFSYLFNSPEIGFRDKRGFVFDDANKYEHEYDRRNFIRDTRSQVIYEESDYISVGDYLPCFKIILPIKRIIVSS